MSISRFIALLLMLSPFVGLSQNRFASEVEEIQARYANGKPEAPVIFAGSSSIRMWRKLEEMDTSKVILNHGFGGSQMSDLLEFSDELILDFSPSMIFIYEGDNDLASNRSVDEIIKDTQTLIKKIRKQHPDIPIVLIAAKPSISRWKYKFQFEHLNREFASIPNKRNNIHFADVWKPMLTEEGKVNPTLFIEDDLHMNEQGYEIWKKALMSFFNPQ